MSYGLFEESARLNSGSLQGFSLQGAFRFLCNLPAASVAYTSEISSSATKSPRADCDLAISVACRNFYPKILGFGLKGPGTLEAQRVVDYGVRATTFCGCWPSAVGAFTPTFFCMRSICALEPSQSIVESDSKHPMRLY